jgi:hypothetical protein
MYFRGLLIDNMPFFIDEKKSRAVITGFPVFLAASALFICLKKKEKGVF